MRQIAPALLGVPVTVPQPGEYVALGAARQAAWALSGDLPRWPVTLTELPPTQHQGHAAEVHERYGRLLATMHG